MNGGQLFQENEKKNMGRKYLFLTWYSSKSSLLFKKQYSDNDLPLFHACFC